MEKTNVFVRIQGTENSTQVVMKMTQKEIDFFHRLAQKVAILAPSYGPKIDYSICSEETCLQLRDWLELSSKYNSDATLTKEEESEYYKFHDFDWLEKNAKYSFSAFEYRRNLRF